MGIILWIGVLMVSPIPDITQALISLESNVKQLTDSLNAQQSCVFKWLPGIVGILSSVAALIVGWINFKASKRQQETSRDLAREQIQATKEITLSQINANFVAVARKEWIEKLRVSISRLLVMTTSIMYQELEMKSSIKQEVLDVYLEKQTYIELMLNPDEEEHNNLIEFMNAYTDICWAEIGRKSKEGDDYKFNDADVKSLNIAKDAFVEKAKQVLKSEWIKVKNLR
jgi:hypothetical protein